MGLSDMTPSEQWILGLFAVYSIPAFLFGVGVTLAFVRWRSRRTTTALMPDFLSPERTFERRDVIALGFAPADNSRNAVPGGLRLR